MLKKFGEKLSKLNKIYELSITNNIYSDIDKDSMLELLRDMYIELNITNNDKFIIDNDVETIENIEYQSDINPLGLDDEQINFIALELFNNSRTDAIKFINSISKLPDIESALLLIQDEFPDKQASKSASILADALLLYLS